MSASPETGERLGSVAPLRYPFLSGEPLHALYPFTGTVGNLIFPHYRESLTRASSHTFNRHSGKIKRVASMPRSLHTKETLVRPVFDLAAMCLYADQTASIGQKLGTHRDIAQSQEFCVKIIRSIYICSAFLVLGVALSTLCQAQSGGGSRKAETSARIRRASRVRLPRAAVSNDESFV